MTGWQVGAEWLCESDGTATCGTFHRGILSLWPLNCSSASSRTLTSASAGQTIRGHRVWVSTVLGYLAEGWTTEAVLVEFPALEGDDVRACLAYAAQLADTRFADLDIG